MSVKGLKAFRKVHDEKKLELQKKYIRDKELSQKKLIQYPEQLIKIAEDYFKELEGNPIEVDELIKGGPLGGTTVKVKKPRAFTFQGLYVFAYKQGYTSLHNFFENTQGLYGEFEDACNLIRSMMYAQKYEGAAAGVFNANLVARDLGLTEKSETNVKVEQPFFDIEQKPKQLSQGDLDLLGEYVEFDEDGR